MTPSTPSLVSAIIVMCVMVRNTSATAIVSDACETAMEAACGKEAHNITACEKCIEAGEATWKKLTPPCTVEEREHFCKPATTPCETVLKKFCSEHRQTHDTCVACATAHENATSAAHCSYLDIERFCSVSPPPPKNGTCSAKQYCCPDVKACVTPVRETSCPTEECEDSEICCPLTKMCVVKGGECKPPSVCGTNSFCCPDAKHCVEVVEATGMKFCEPQDKDACKSHGAGIICCPLISQCVKVGVACDPTAADQRPYPSFL